LQLIAVLFRPEVPTGSSMPGLYLRVWRVVMTQKQYVVTLTAEERAYLSRLVSAGKLSARSLARARILLKADVSSMGPSWEDARIAEAVEVSIRTVEHVRQRFATRGLKASLVQKPPDRSGRLSKVDGQRLKELAHQSPRNFGKKRSTWTLRLLADTCSELRIVDGKVSYKTVRLTLKRLGVKWRRAELWMTSPDPHYAQKKARRDRFIRLASKHPDWVLGFLDEVWWSRLARPPLRAWSAGDPLKMHVLAQPEDDPDPVAICCYGMLRQDTDKVMLRFVDGRPVGDVTAQFLAWLCEQLDAEGKTRLIVIWDDASWHSGKPVSDWIAEYNRKVKRNGGVEIVLCPLPAKSPWLNNIETRWGPAKRAILDPDRLLTGQEVVARVCEHFGCEPLPYLKSRSPQQVEAQVGS
jgi:transposase